MSYSHIKAWRTRKKDQLIAVFGGRCGICGYDRCSSAFDFHHLDPSAKEHSISGLNNRTLVAREISKCVMLCSNCHREVHAKITIVPADIKRVTYEEVMAAMPIACQRGFFSLTKKMSDPLRSKEHRGITDVQIAKQCGVSLKILSNWRHKTRRLKNTRLEAFNTLTRDKLLTDIKTTPITRIAELYGVSPNTIPKWCAHHNIDHKKLSPFSHKRPRK